MALGAKRKASQTTQLTGKLDKERAGVAVVRVDSSPCPICQEPVGQCTPDDIIESWSELPCGHRFGSHCIKMWLGMSIPGDPNRPVCPVCRGPASHACGHPVLPTDAALEGVWGEDGHREKKAKTDNEPEDIVAKRQTACDMAQRTVCGYCIEGLHSPWPMARKRRRLWPWRFVKGCWLMVLYVRPRAWRRRRRPHEIIYVPPLGEPDKEWEKWWKAQDPCGV